MSELIKAPSEGIRLLGELEAAGAITATSLTLPPDLPFDRYEALMAMFGQLHRTSAWLIGDGLNYGERVYGETYAQAAEATGLSRGALINYASVCSHIPKSRRRATVPFSTHMEVAYLEPAEQKEWLDKAAANRWTKEELRAARKASTDGVTPAVEVSCVCPTCGDVHTHVA